MQEDGRERSPGRPKITRVPFGAGADKARDAPKSAAVQDAGATIARIIQFPFSKASGFSPGRPTTDRSDFLPS